ncbi:hypothetical protein LCGC14_1310590 [marine sediment metagenome]|uniref:Uncharacterized protein n=1 Tax=marine sediment metagenome TaxID=412755 RepID=A0A0F9N3Q7_9ZZZZ
MPILALEFTNSPGSLGYMRCPHCGRKHQNKSVVNYTPLASQCVGHHNQLVRHSGFCKICSAHSNSKYWQGMSTRTISR